MFFHWPLGFWVCSYSRYRADFWEVKGTRSKEFSGSLQKGKGYLQQGETKGLTQLEEDREQRSLWASCLVFWWAWPLVKPGLSARVGWDLAGS